MFCSPAAQIEACRLVFDGVFCGLSDSAAEFLHMVPQRHVDLNPLGCHPPSESFRKEMNNRLNKILPKKGVGHDDDGDVERIVENKAARDALKVVFALLEHQFLVSINSQELCASGKDLLEKFPSFSKADVSELDLLVNFYNFMVAALKLIEADNNKEKLLYICGVLSAGKAIKYIAGSWQTDLVSRRVEIYERLGNITPKPSKKGTKRSHSETDSESSDSGASSSSKHSYFSDLSSEELEFDDDIVALLHDFVAPQEGASSSSASLLVEDAENEIEVNAEFLDFACEFLESCDFECDLKVFDDTLSGSPIGSILVDHYVDL